MDPFALQLEQHNKSFHFKPGHRMTLENVIEKLEGLQTILGRHPPIKLKEGVYLKTDIYYYDPERDFFVFNYSLFLNYDYQALFDKNHDNFISKQQIVEQFVNMTQKMMKYMLKYNAQRNHTITSSIDFLICSNATKIKYATMDDVTFEKGDFKYIIRLDKTRFNKPNIKNN
jgi:hypothetical protein